jgi:hypothetical protein
MERGAAGVALTNPDGDYVILPDPADKSLVEQVQDALRVAQTSKQAARVAAQTLTTEDTDAHATHLPAPRAARPRDAAHAAAGPEQEAEEGASGD